MAVHSVLCACPNPCHPIFASHVRYEVDIYESRPFIGGKVASYVDKDGNHIEVCACALGD
jgi:uncharacterized protein with NAD-binding domain and iron-sulfur cluster